MEKSNLLIVDDEPRILRSLSMLFKRDFNLFTTTEAKEALATTSRIPIHVVISDQRMPGMTGVDLFTKVKKVSPNTMRILLTGYSDVGAVIDSINQGEIFRYITKPWVNQDVKEIVKEAAAVARDLFSQKPAEKPEHLPKPLPKDGAIMVLGRDNSLAAAIFNLLKRQIKVFPVSDFGKAVNLMEKESIALVLADIRGSNTNYTTIVKILKREYPLAVSMVFADAKDAELGIELINQGQVFRYITDLKPKNVHQSLKEALQHYQNIRHNPARLNQHRVEHAPESETQRFHQVLSSRLPNIRKRMFSLLHSQ